MSEELNDLRRALLPAATGTDHLQAEVTRLRAIEEAAFRLIDAPAVRPPAALELPPRFSGCTEVITVANHRDLVAMVASLSACHPHNFCVQGDIPDSQGAGRIITSAFGVGCLRNAFSSVVPR